MFEPLILAAQAGTVYLLVLWTHALRHKAGLAPFYAMLGSITALVSWLTDAGVAVEFGGITFMIGSTVGYTALLLGVFVVYVFDGPLPARIAIFAVAGISALTPLVATVLHVQANLAGQGLLAAVPLPSMRTNVASVLTTVADLVFLAISWEFLGKARLRISLGLRAYLTLLGVMCLDVALFSTAAFVGSPAYVPILVGTLSSRLIISLLAWPFLFAYINWQNQHRGFVIENRPVLAVLKEVAEVRQELSQAQQEIERRKLVEAEKERLIKNLEGALTRVHWLEGMLPVCSSCRRIRIDSTQPGVADTWVSLEAYMRERSSAKFTHGICDDCIRRLYPAISDQVIGPPDGAS